MRRSLALPILPFTVLVLALLPAPAAASGHVQLDIDVTDALDDSRAYPDIRLPQTDITRFTSHVEGAQVVQVVTVIGPWPDNDYHVEIRNSFGSNEYLELKVERMDSAGSRSVPTDYATSFRQSSNTALVGNDLNFTFERTTNTLTIRWPASELPSDAKCFQPVIKTGSIGLVDGREVGVSDELTISPNTCAASGVRTDGLDGTCPPVTRPAVKAATLQDPRDDVGERDNLAFKPHDNATLDILSLGTRVEDGWVIETVALAEASPRDVIDLEIQRQYRGNKSQFERGAYLLVTLYETDASGAIIGEGALGSFHVRTARVEPAGWEFRYCASVVPEDAECFAPLVRASMDKGDLQDTLRIVPDPCPPKDDEASDEGAGEGEDAGEGADSGAGSAKGDEASDDASSDTPGLGALALLAAVAAAALTFRRRA